VTQASRPIGVVPVEATLDNCIKCNICVTACPVAPATDLFPGPKYEGPQAGRFRHDSQPSPDRSVDYCSGCRMCNEVCPTGVRIAEINARARAAMVADGAFGRRARLRNNLLARPLLLGDLGAPAPGLVNWLFSFAPTRWMAEKLFAIDRRAPLPLYDGPRFRRWFASRPAVGGKAGTIVYFTACSTEHYETRVGRATVRLLEHLGFDVIVPEARCCGLPLLSNGEFPAARRYHRANVDSLIAHARAGRAIVGTSTSCTLTLKEEAPDLLDVHDNDSNLVAAHTFDIHEFLLGLADEGALTGMRPLPMRLPYHPPCQYRAHRLGIPATEVMRLVPDLEVVESGVGCCGIAGTYAYKTEKYQIGMDVGRPLFEFVAREGAPVVACDSETCRWQITHGTGVPAIHPVEIVAAALGVEVEGPLAEALRPLY
jgi:glycerol-3-phosphate dehydrogenase subunit C